MKTLNIFMIVLFFASFAFSQADTIPTKFYGVAENESYTYISTNIGLYILERDSNNIFREIYNVGESLGLLHIHNNYLISGNVYELKIFDIAQPTNPLLYRDTLINYPVSEFENFNNYFVIRFDLNGYEDKFLIADIIDDKLQVLFDSDSASPSLSHIRRGSEFYYPYAFLCFNSWKDTLRIYRFNHMQNDFNRLPLNFTYQQDFILASAYSDLLYTGDHHIDLYGDRIFTQNKYDIDSTTNTFTRLNTWRLFGIYPEEMNSFTIISQSQAPWIARKYDFSAYNPNVGFGHSSRIFTMDNNVYVAHTDDNLYYSSRVTADSIIYKLIDFDPSNVEVLTTELNVFNLSQNYPNPFNPTTKIKYQIPQLSFVTLKIYGVLGNEVATLIYNEKLIGSYEVEFNATGLPSGIYFYQLRADNFVETKKMVLLK